jgi:PncC family amidohydrolase
MLTAVPGSSDAFAGGWITYTNELKSSALGVDRGLIERHGAVSAEVALAMAEGACRASGASLSVAITGIAGPGGAVPGKPVGTVWIAVHDAVRGSGRARRFEFPGARDIVRDRAAKTALQLARWQLAGEDAPIIWERS